METSEQKGTKKVMERADVSKEVSSGHTQNVMKKLEKQGEKDLKKSFDPLSIVFNGGKKFEEEVGRPMTYAEMRSMYG
jgi:hypothetical protein